jgi:hypothetical protein
MKTLRFGIQTEKETLDDRENDGRIDFQTEQTQETNIFLNPIA